jgi:hypothetical protein
MHSGILNHVGDMFPDLFSGLNPEKSAVGLVEMGNDPFGVNHAGTFVDMIKNQLQRLYLLAFFSEESVVETTDSLVKLVVGLVMEFCIKFATCRAYETKMSVTCSSKYKLGK